MNRCEDFGKILKPWPNLVDDYKVTMMRCMEEFDNFIISLISALTLAFTIC